MFQRSGDGFFHFKLPSGRTFAVAPPRLRDLKVAAVLSGASGSELADNLNLSEAMAGLLLRAVDGRPMTHEAFLAAGGLEGIFDGDLADCLEILRIVGELKGAGKATPLEDCVRNGGTP